MSLPQSQGFSSTPPESLEAATASQPIQKNFSCILCSQRKVKCDRRPGGCIGCTKLRVACIYKAPPPPRRRRKGVRDVDATTRIRIYEDILRHLGVDPEELVKQELKKLADTESVLSISGVPEPHKPTQKRRSHLPAESGILVSEDGRSRYLENGIWTSLKGEFRESKEILDESSDDEPTESHDRISPDELTTDSSGLLFGSQASSARLRPLHPEPVQTFKLWQSYLNNINPLVKVFHAPTVQQIISDACGSMDDLPRDVEALMFGIYCIATESLSDGECIAILGKSKSVVIHRFRLGAQQALVNTSLLKTSNLMVLQAFTLFVLSLQNYDARVIWIFSGIAQRIGQRIGLHRDGELLGLPPFEVEMRRRLWWQIIMLEGFSQKLAGTGNSNQVVTGDMKMPSNVNDSDIFLGMKEIPKDREGATEMMFFLIRCLVGDFLRRATNTHTTFDGVWNNLTTNKIQVAIKDKAIDELYSLFKQRFLQYCDPSIAWHTMCIQLAEAIIAMMRFMTHSTEYSTAEMSQCEKDILFDLALQVVTDQNFAYTMPEMQGFMWHVNMHFQWKAFIYIVSELRHRTEGIKVEKAWEEIEKSYNFHPSFDKELSVRAMPVAVSNLTLKAWDVYVAARGIPQSGEPHFIQLVRRQQARTNCPKKSIEAQRAEAATNMPSSAFVLQNGMGDITSSSVLTVDSLEALDWDAANLNVGLGAAPDPFDNTSLNFPEAMNWSSWDDLLVDFQKYDDSLLPTDLSSFNFNIE